MFLRNQYCKRISSSHSIYTLFQYSNFVSPLLYLELEFEVMISLWKKIEFEWITFLHNWLHLTYYNYLWTYILIQAIHSIWLNRNDEGIWNLILQKIIDNLLSESCVSDRVNLLFLASSEDITQFHFARASQIIVIRHWLKSWQLLKCYVSQE